MAKKLISLFNNCNRYSAAAVLVLAFIILTTPYNAHATSWICQRMPYPDACENSFVGQTIAAEKTAVSYVTTWVADATIGSTFKDLAALIFFIANLIFIACGWIFDTSIGFAMTDPSSFNGVTDGWAIIRDVTNLFFIFIVLAISIATILRRESYGAKALLPRLIIVALLINFSMPISKAIIDVNNVLATKFYTALTTGIAGETTSVSGKLNDTLGMATIMKSTTAGANSILGHIKNAPDSTFNTRMGIYFLGSSAVVLVTSFVLLAFSFFFIARVIYLAFLLILSPLAYLGMVLPYTSGYAQKWWGAFLHQSLVAPVGMFALYVALTMAQTFKLDNGANHSFAEIFQGNINSVDVIFQFILIIGILIGALHVTRSLGAVGASTAISWGNAAYKGAKGYAGGMTKGYVKPLVGDTLGKMAEKAGPGVLGTILTKGARIGEAERKAKTESFTNMSDGALKAARATTRDPVKIQKINDELARREDKKNKEAPESALVAREGVLAAKETANTASADELKELHKIRTELEKRTAAENKRLQGMSATMLTNEKALLNKLPTSPTQQAALARIAAEETRRNAASAQTAATQTQQAAQQRAATAAQTAATSAAQATQATAQAITQLTASQQAQAQATTAALNAMANAINNLGTRLPPTP